MAYNRTLQHFTSPQELATLWATGQTYLLNQVVFQDNKLYRCLINHTSGTFQTDYANSNWVEISSGLVPWITAVYYTANQFVEQGNDIYRCLISHTSGTFATDLGAGKWIEVSAGSGSGLKNYVVNGDFEQNTDTGWSLASSTLDATTKLPNQVSASWTSASGSLSKSVISSGQLAGTYSLQLSSTAATTAGNMLVTNALTLDLEAQASVQTFSFFYKVTSNGTGTPDFSGTSSNAIGVAIYDVTNSAWIQPAGVFNLVQSSGVGKASGTFQCPSNCTSVRLAVYFPNSTAASGGSPFTVVFDDFVLGPQVVQYGAPVTDWVSFTPVWTASTTNPTIGNGTLSGKYRRIGDSIEVSIGLSIGTTTSLGSGAWTFAHPSLVPDLTKIEQASTLRIVGVAEGNSGGATQIGSVEASSTGLLIRGALNVGAAQWSPVYPAAWVNTNVLTINATYPVTGLSSSVSMSNDTDTRVVAMYASTATGTITGSPSDVTWSTITKDTNSSFNGTTYTVPVSGYYQISSQVRIAATYAVGQAVGLNLNINGSNVQYGLARAGGAQVDVSPTLTTIRYLNAGDLVKIQADSAGTTPSFSGGGGYNYLSINRLSGPATIAASETVAARFGLNSAQSLSSSPSVINFPLKDYDTHGSVTTGAAWKFTAPISGLYTITSSFRFANGLSWTSGNFIAIEFVKNGVTTIARNDSLHYATITPVTVAPSIKMTASVRLTAGEYVSIYGDQNEATSRALLAASSFCYVEITRTGN